MSKLITIEMIDNNGPTEKQYSVEDAISFINSEKRNNKTIFINGTPYMSDIIDNSAIENAKVITIMNQLVGG